MAILFISIVMLAIGCRGASGNVLHPILVAAVEWSIWIKICNLKDGGSRDKDKGMWKRRGYIIIIRASSFAQRPKPSPHQHPQNSLWSVVTPIKPAKPSLSGQAADLQTPRQQIGLGEGLQPDKGLYRPLLLHLKSITLAFTISVPPRPRQQWKWAWAGYPNRVTSVQTRTGHVGKAGGGWIHLKASVAGSPAEDAVLSSAPAKWFPMELHKMSFFHPIWHWAIALIFQHIPSFVELNELFGKRNALCWASSLLTLLDYQGGFCLPFTGQYQLDETSYRVLQCGANRSFTSLVHLIRYQTPAPPKSSWQLRSLKLLGCLTAAAIDFWCAGYPMPSCLASFFLSTKKKPC